MKVLLMFRRNTAVSAVIIISFLLITDFPEQGIGSVDSEAKKRHFTFSYELSISDIPREANDLKIWIPFPLTDRDQNIENYRISSQLPYYTYIDPEYGNNILGVKSTGKIPEEVKIKLDFEVTRREAGPLTEERTDNHGADLRELGRFLAADRLVPIDGKIAEEAKQVISDDMSGIEKAQAVYNHLTKVMRYDKSGTEWGHGDALYACDTRKGNCTDIHSLFIGMMRACGIPARFVIGFPVPEERTAGEIPGYHCWAEFHLEDKGWIPVDISEAIKHPEKKEYYFGRLDPNRISFTVGRDIPLEADAQYGRLNFFIYPYILINGRPFDNAEYSFSFAQK